jgi:hypothetical protein
MAAESSSRRAICNAVLLDTNTLPPIRTVALAAGAECKPSEAEAVRRSKYQPKPVHGLLIHRLKSLPQSVWLSGNCSCLCASLVLSPSVVINLTAGHGCPECVELRGCLNTYCSIGQGSPRIV